VAGYGASGDDEARFLLELRQLRDGAGLGHAELAARAHYPYDSIRAAEVGPSLPDLPVLSAFVRACGGTTEEWEERWRSLTKTPSLPVAEARQSGQSDAADAGARINSATSTGEGTPNPSVIIAALSRVAEEMATPGADVPTSPVVSPRPDFPPPPRPGDLPTAGSKPAGWDPIRVSSAWPALEHTPAVSEPARDTATANGAGVPWGAAPRADDPVGAAAEAGSRSLAADSHGRPLRASRTAIVVAAVLVLCVIVALLVIFA
jgi:Helix-turn-helix domain